MSYRTMKRRYPNMTKNALLASRHICAKNALAKTGSKRAGMVLRALRRDAHETIESALGEAQKERGSRPP